MRRSRVQFLSPAPKKPEQKQKHRESQRNKVACFYAKAEVASSPSPPQDSKDTTPILFNIALNGGESWHPFVKLKRVDLKPVCGTTMNRYQFSRHEPASRKTPFRTVPEKGRCYDRDAGQGYKTSRCNRTHRNEPLLDSHRFCV
jgi:hypothetical protein